MKCKSILIAEDNTDIRDSLAEALISEGYHVYTAKNGKEALTKLEAIPGPTLVLLDLMMPVMSGWEFIDAQKKNAVLEPHQIVVVSAIKATQSLEDRTPLDVSDSINKPLDLIELLEKVRKYCGIPQDSLSEVS